MRRFAGLFAAFVLVVATRHSFSQESQFQGREQRKSENSEQQDDLKKSLLLRRDELVAQSDDAKDRGMFLQAIELRDQVFAIETDVFGEVHEELLNTLDAQAKIAQYADRCDLAIEIRHRALRIGDKIYNGEDYQHSDLKRNLADSIHFAKLPLEQRKKLVKAAQLNTQVFRLFQQGKFREAIAFAEEAVEIRRELLGNQHPDYAMSLYNLAAQYSSIGQFKKAELLYLEAKEIREKVLGKKHPDYPSCLSNLASLYSQSGEYSKAESLYLEVNAIEEQVLGNQHPDFARGGNDLATLYVKLNNYAKAESLYTQAKKIFELTLGKEHPDYATNLINIAALHELTGNFSMAEQFLLEAKAICEKQLGKKHPSYATHLNNLASLYHSIGDYAKTERLLLESKDVLRDALGEEHPSYARCLNNLGSLYTYMEDYRRAERHLLEAKNLVSRALGKQHPEYAMYVGNLAMNYACQKDFSNAELLYLEKKTVLEKTVGKQHRYYANTLSQLAQLYCSTGKLVEAEKLFNESNEVLIQALGKKHPEYAQNLHNWGRLCSELGVIGRADRLFEEGLTIVREHLDITASVLNETSQMIMERGLRERLDDYLQHCVKSPSLPKKAAEFSLLWKGSTLRRLRIARQAASDPAIADQFNRLRNTTAIYSKLVQQTPRPNQAEAWRKQVAELSEQRDELEADLMRASATYAKAVKPTTVSDIRAALPEDGILVSYLEVRAKNGRQIIATILPREGETKLISLGILDDLSLVDKWLESFGTSSDGRQVGEALRKKIWDPLLEHIGSASTIFVSTDGELGRLPLAALPGNKPGTYLIEQHRIVLIPVPQLLPELMENRNNLDLSNHLLALGDIDFDSTPVPLDSPQQPQAESMNNVWLAQRGSGKLHKNIVGESKWTRLPGTGAEVDFIASLFAQQQTSSNHEIRKLRNNMASETAFRELAPRSRFVHIATHGFFADSSKKSALTIDPEKAGESSFAFDKFSEREFVGFNPGQLSGLVFAGANLSRDSVEFTTTSNSSTSDDGILTADEIAYLPLQGCELMVLSACETNVGKVAGGEGILGLQRSFQLAGARSVISSLWKVDDLERVYSWNASIQTF